MDINLILSLLGGLALFLFGMKMMSDGLEQAAGDKMKRILERLTSNRILGVLVGAGITAVIQSSSATTVMVVGFVNSGLMTLRQAIWVIMGANIGTTITGQLIALDVGKLAPIMAIMGVIFILFTKSKKLVPIGYILGGLGILFIGMNTMSDSMVPLRDNEMFVNTITNLQNPLLGILVGAIFTAVIQSSSASVGILQALSTSGVISLGSSVYVLFGQNIGTCITAVLASIGTSRSAKRTTIIHLLFNLIGTIIFVTICAFLPFVSWVEGMTPDNPAAQIANVHTIFNITTSLLLLPVGGFLELIAKKVLPEREDEERGMVLKFISPASLKSHTIGSVTIAISQIKGEMIRMYDITTSNVERAFDLVEKYNENVIEDIRRDEEYVDFLNAEISKYISSIISTEMTEHDGETIAACYKIIGNIERISDHAMNIAEYAKHIKKKKDSLSSAAVKETVEMRVITLHSLSLIDINENHLTAQSLIDISLEEKKIDKMSKQFRKNQLSRMKNDTCKGEISVLYSEMITDFERIGDHILNIAESMAEQTHSF